MSGDRPWIAPGSEETSTGNPLSRKTSIIRWFCGHHLGVEDRDAVVDGDLREVGEQDRREPVPLQAVRDRERHLGVFAPSPM